MKTFGKIVLAILSIVSFLGAILGGMSYYLGGLDYLYYIDASVNRIYNCLIISLIAFVLLISMIVIMFLKRIRSSVRLTCLLLLICLIPSHVRTFFLGINYSTWIGTDGCSYTTDISNYGNYDVDYSFSHFPKQITDEMTVVDFAYYYKYADCDQIELYLEVKFDNQETMEKYLSTAFYSHSKKGAVEYQNPYDEKYTDMFFLYYNSHTHQWDAPKNSIAFGNDYNYKYAYITYETVSYSYEQLTIIYSYIYMGEDIEFGDDLAHNEYYPEYLKRFGVEWGEKQ